jgi:hypothetical protein
MCGGCCLVSRRHCRLIRNHKEKHRLPVLAMSAFLLYVSAKKLDNDFYDKTGAFSFTHINSQIHTMLHSGTEFERADPVEGTNGLWALAFYSHIINHRGAQFFRESELTILPSSIGYDMRSGRVCKQLDGLPFLDANQ